MKKNEFIPTSAVEDCPFFEKCQLNNCPLHIDYGKLKTLQEDKKLFNFKPCKLTRAKRMALGKKWNLKNLGLTSRERHFTETWDKLSPEEKQARIDRLKSFSPLIKNKQISNLSS